MTLKITEMAHAIADLDEKIEILQTQRETLRLEIINEMEIEKINKFVSGDITLTYSLTKRTSQPNIERLSADYDLSDCYEMTLSMNLIKQRTDIKLENYCTIQEIPTLRVKINTKSKK